LIAYDLASSRPVASLVLKGVTYGSWGDQSWNPGFALSPDGRQIAVYDDRKNALTLVDALRMKVLQTESLTRSQSVVDRLAEWLGIEPTDAWAKGEEYGADLQMRFSPDGRMLYVTGNENLPHVLAATPGPVGIRAIDVARHEITGEALTRSPLAWVQPAPDGSALYALSLFGDDLEPFAAIVRLDPRTLQIQGQQVVTLHDGHPRYYLLAASAR
jgi:hypothetical protein